MRSLAAAAGSDAGVSLVGFGEFEEEEEGSSSVAGLLVVGGVMLGL